MKKALLAAVSLACTAAAFGQTQAVQPTWDLNKNPIDPASIQGKVELVDGVIKMDCTNSFTIPAKVLGDQKDYTIEFELKLADNFEVLPRVKGALCLVTNRDPGAHAGLAVTYLPPKWDLNGGISNRIGLEVNAYWNGETSGLDGAKFNKYSIVVKDKLMAVYRNGLLQALTDAVNPSSQPLTVGGPGWRGTALPAKETVSPIPQPYELRSLKIFDKAIEPADLNPNANVMRNCSGDQFNMQRAVIKDPKLPRILVVGDSISMGYRPFITEHFKGRAYVDYWVGGGWLDPNAVQAPDAPIKRAWSGVLSQGPYDVVTWNCMGLHMWTAKMPGRCPVESFPGNMTAVVEHLQKTAPNTKFIWVRTTPYTMIPAEGQPSVIDTEKSARLDMFNKLADEVVTKRGLPEADLYSLCLTMPEKASKDGVHWSGEASQTMANTIIQLIEERLPKKQ